MYPFENLEKNNNKIIILQMTTDLFLLYTILYVLDEVIDFSTFLI